jgi:putative membrane protein
MAYILFRYLHFIAIIGFAGALIVENSAISRTITSEDSRNLAKVDAVYGVSAILVLLFGLVLWLWVGKPSEFYSQNPLFLVKLGLFIVVGLLSISPTVFLFKHRKSEASSIAVPTLVIWSMRAELIVLLLIPILAILMARGIGLNG